MHKSRAYKNKVHKNTTRKKAKRSVNRKYKKTRKQGGASVNQIGKAAMMRSWLSDDILRQQLNDIVHSADKPSRFNEHNAFKDISASHDPALDTILNRAERNYGMQMATRRNQVGPLLVNEPAAQNARPTRIFYNVKKSPPKPTEENPNKMVLLTRNKKPPLLQDK